MINTPKSHRIHIGVFGRRNAGKSSLINSLCQQQVSIVSNVPGTTTDPIEKSMELQPLGPVLFIDTPGLDDTGTLGEARIERSLATMQRIDLGLLVIDGDLWNEFEDGLLAKFCNQNTPVVVVFNKSDQVKAIPLALTESLSGKNVPWVCTTCLDTCWHSLDELRQAMLRALPDSALRTPPLLSDLVPAGGLAVLVVPIDMEAPKGRLILPQVQAIRDLLDGEATAVVCRDRELTHTLRRLAQPPDLVVTDSQAFLKVAADTPSSIPMTSFSILMARQKGDLAEFVRGVRSIETLKPGDEILVCEACTHHPQGDDIGRTKIPRWLRQYAGVDLRFTHRQGHDFPNREELRRFKLVIHCGGCMHNARQMLWRIGLCREAGVPISNYGVVIAYSLGIFERALAPFRSLVYELSTTE